MRKNPFDELVEELTAFRKARRTTLAKAQQSLLLMFKRGRTANVMAKAESMMQSGALSGREFHRLDIMARMAAKLPALGVKP